MGNKWVQTPESLYKRASWSQALTHTELPQASGRMTSNKPHRVANYEAFQNKGNTSNAQREMAFVLMEQYR